MMVLVAATVQHNPNPTPTFSGPSGSPTEAIEYLYGGDFIGLQWANADLSADTQIGYRDGGGEPLSVTALVAQGGTIYETNGTVSTGWWVRHFKNAQSIANATGWVSVSPGE